MSLKHYGEPGCHCGSITRMVCPIHGLLPEPITTAENPRDKGWIKVEERLPERSADFGGRRANFSDSVVIFPNQCGDVSVGSYWHDVGVWEEDNDQCVRVEVTHWQPLPEPPA